MARPSPDSWNAISPLLDDVLDLPAGERCGRLAQLRRQHPEVADALGEWLREYEVMDSGGFIEGPTSRLPAASALDGLELGPYRLVELIGQGGMGAVWRAERRDGQFDQRVAVKLINAAMMDRSGTERFAREAAILARLTHPAICRLLDAGVAPFGAPYLVLEHVQGEHVDRYCDARRLGIRDRLRLFLDVLAPVAHAHANLIVHRDLKPANVLVSDDGHVKLLDFGIAKLLHAGADAPTASGSRDGALTPAFAAPEQLTGEPVTTATDVYALGVLLYQLLTGCHPSLGETVTPAALVEAVVHVDPPRASEAAGRAGESVAGAAARARSTPPERLRRDLAGDLDTILAKSLKKAPAERYATVTAFESDIRRYLTHRPISARPDTTGYRLRKFARRHRVPVALAATALLALVGGLAGTLTMASRATAQAARADRQAAEATAQRDFARRQLVRAEAVNDLNAFLIADAAPMGSTFTARDLLARAERIASRQADDPDGARVDSLISIGALYGNIGEIARSTALLEQAYAGASMHADASLRARAACQFGHSVVKTGDIARARQLIDEGLAAIPAGEQYALTRVECHMAGTGTENWADEGERSLEHVLAARKEAQQSGVASPLLMLKISMNVAEAMRMARRPVDADRAFADAYGQLAALGREDTERAGTLLNNWALVLGSLGRPLEAERMLRRSIAISTAAGNERGVEPISWANLARAVFDLGQYAEAARLADRAVQGAREKGDTVVADQSELLAARAHVAAGDVERGAAMLDAVDRRFTSMFPAGHGAFAAVATDRVRLALARRDLPRALELANDAVAMMESQPKYQASIPVALRRRIDVLLAMGRYADARADAERLVPLVLKAAPGSGPSAIVGSSYLTLGEALAGERRPEEARAALEQARQHLEAAAGPNHPGAVRARELLARPD
jgi:serine/threonine-protein kinase